MNPNEFLQTADELSIGLREGDWRSAVSRSYYAVFHVARRVLQQCRFAVPRADQAHVYLGIRLANSGHPDVKQAGKNFQHLRSIRNQADYDIDDLFDQRQAIDAVQLASDIITLLETTAATPAVLTQITDTIRVYERDILKQVTWHS